MKKLKSYNQFNWQSFLAQIANYAVSGVAVVFLWIYLSHNLAITSFGEFNLIFTLVAIYGLFTDFGIDFWVTKRGATSPTTAFFRNLARFRIVLGVIVGIIFLLVAYIRGYSLFPSILFLFGAYILNIAHFFSCYLRAIDKLDIEAKYSIIRNIMYVGLSVAGVQTGGGVTWVSLSYLIANSLFLICILYSVKKNNFFISSESQSIYLVLKSSIPVWLCGLVVGLSLKVEIIFLDEFLGKNEVAVFSTASRLFEGALLLATAFVLTMFPFLSRCFSDSPKVYKKEVVKHGVLLLALVVLFSVVLALLSPSLFSMFYDQEYQQGAHLLTLLALVLPISVMVHYLHNVLTIADGSKVLLISLTISLTFNVLLVLYLIPLFHIEGALMSFAIKETVLLLMLLVSIYRLRIDDTKHQLLESPL